MLGFLLTNVMESLSKIIHKLANTIQLKVKANLQWYAFRMTVDSYTLTLLQPPTSSFPCCIKKHRLEV